MSKKRIFLDMYRFETYINGFLDLEYPNFDPKHGFLSSVEVEIISFFQRRQPFAFSAFYVHPLTFEGGSPSKFDKQDLETWLKKLVSFICSDKKCLITFSFMPVIYVKLRAIFQPNGGRIFFFHSIGIIISYLDSSA